MKAIYVYGALLSAALLSGCGKDARDPQLQYGDPTPAKLQFTNMPWYDFAGRAVGTESWKTITIANTGTSVASQLKGSFYLSVHFSFKGGTFPGASGTCGDFLEPASTCTVIVAFSPQYVGTFEQPLTVLFFDGFANQKAIGPYLRGEGI